MNRKLFACVLFLAFSVPLSGWVMQPGNFGFLACLAGVAVVIWFLTGSINRTRKSLKTLSIFYLLAGIGATLLLQKTEVIASPQIITVGLCLIAVVVVTTLVADMITMLFWGEEDR